MFYFNLSERKINELHDILYGVTQVRYGKPCINDFIKSSNDNRVYATNTKLKVMKPDLRLRIVKDKEGKEFMIVINPQSENTFDDCSDAWTRVLGYLKYKIVTFKNDQGMTVKSIYLLNSDTCIFPFEFDGQICKVLDMENFAKKKKSKVVKLMVDETKSPKTDVNILQEEAEDIYDAIQATTECNRIERVNLMEAIHNQINSKLEENDIVISVSDLHNETLETLKDYFQNTHVTRLKREYIPLHQREFINKAEDLIGWRPKVKSYDDGTFGFKCGLQVQIPIAHYDMSIEETGREISRFRDQFVEWGYSLAKKYNNRSCTPGIKMIFNRMILTNDYVLELDYLYDIVNQI
ncbi:MAG: hypothetical protein PHC62_00450 [Candidatus Izemoplasmatales bacterium]|nr:hypothetical protein [Candidatus Izemoplasmatales bacterium]